MHCLILISLHDQWLENHTFILIKQCKHHIKMDEGLRLRRQLLHQHIISAARTIFPETLYHEINTLRCSSGTISNNQDILSGNDYISTLHDYRRC